jgi:hypothetical protein
MDFKLAAMSKIDKTAPAKTQLDSIDRLYHNYPENLESRDQKMWCPIAIFPSRIHAYSVLNLIFSFDLFAAFWILVTLCALETSNSRGRAFIGGALLWVLAHFFITVWVKRFLNSTKDFEGLRKRMKCWFWNR